MASNNKYLCIYPINLQNSAGQFSSHSLLWHLHQLTGTTGNHYNKEKRLVALSLIMLSQFGPQFLVTFNGEVCKRMCYVDECESSMRKNQGSVSQAT